MSTLRTKMQNKVKGVTVTSLLLFRPLIYANKIILFSFVLTKKLGIRRLSVQSKTAHLSMSVPSLLPFHYYLLGMFPNWPNTTQTAPSLFHLCSLTDNFTFQDELWCMGDTKISKLHKNKLTIWDKIIHLKSDPL